MIEITITRTLNEDFASEKELSEMPDDKVIELIFDDFGKFIDGATWSVVRTVPNIV